MRKLYIYCGIILCLIAACLVFLALQPRYFPLDDSSFPISYESDTVITSDTATSDTPASDTGTAESGIADTEPSVTEPPEDDPPTYVCPKELSDAMKTNPDVYAWITVPGTNINYPVLQSSKNDSYYLRRNIKGKYKVSGSLLTEHKYNGTDFEDPVTVIYGHCMKSGAMFGKMQTYYSSENGIKKYGTVEILLPDKKLEYEVFAAVPYDARHILYNYDFADPHIYSSFFKSIASIRAFNASVDANEKPKFGDRVLILSTCLKGDISKRYLVMAKLKTI